MAGMSRPIFNKMLLSKMNSEDLSSIDAIITAAYDVISGPPGQPRNWERERSLFFPDARCIPTATKAGDNKSGLAPQFLDIESYIARVEPFFREHGFYETEIARRTEHFGQIAHVWSTYESRHSLDDPEPFMRGINSFQLFHDGGRWWIVNIFWQHESAAHPLPEKYQATDV